MSDVADRPDVSDLEDGEVAESDSEVIEVPIATPAAAQKNTPEQTDGKIGKGNEVKTGSHAEDRDRHQKEDASSKLARKRKNRKMRKDEEMMAKKSKTSAQIKLLEAAEMDEFEMLCVNGASPPRTAFDASGIHMDPYASDNSEDQRYYRSNQLERREQRRQRNRRRRRSDSHDDSHSVKDDGVCQRNFRGQCTDSSCKRSHEFRGPRKLELCKFFLTGQCMKSNHCTYMHNDFPCKYFYLGIAHDKRKCQFAHGGPLEQAMQGALLKHIERAPKEILGDFPRLYQTQAGPMMRAQHKVLLKEEKLGVKSGPDLSGGSKMKKKKNSRRHRNEDETIGHLEPIDPNDESGRWSPSGKLRVVLSKTKPIARMEPVDRPDMSKIRLDTMHGILTVGQILGLRDIGVEFSHQIDQLTVAQMNEIGLGIGQIHQIQLAATAGTVVKVAEIEADKTKVASLPDGSNDSESTSFQMNSGFYQDISQDVDMRRFPVLAPRTLVPDLSAFGIDSAAMLTTSAPLHPVVVNPIVSTTSSVSDQASLLPNVLLDSTSNAHPGCDDDVDDDDDDDDGQLVIESDPEADEDPQ